MIRIRLAQKPDLAIIAKIRIDNWRTTYKGLLPQGFLDELDYEKETNSWEEFIKKDLHQVYVAIDKNDVILGFAGIKPFENESNIGELHALHTSQAARGKGAGKALIYYVAAYFKNQNINEMRLWVVTGNDKAEAIYKHLGAEIYITRVDKINGTDVPEIGMRWSDLSLM